LFFAVLAGFAGLVMLFAAGGLIGYFAKPGEPKEHKWIAAAVAFGLAIFCFFETYRFHRFYVSPEIRDRYYARSRLCQTRHPKARN
jgi:hypothetical protein